MYVFRKPCLSSSFQCLLPAVSSHSGSISQQHHHLLPSSLAKHHFPKRIRPFPLMYVNSSSPKPTVCGFPLPLAFFPVPILTADPTTGIASSPPQSQRNWKVERKLDLTDTIKDGARLFFVDEGIRRQLLLALTEDSKLHIEELVDVYRLVEDQIDIPSVAVEVARDFPTVVRDLLLSWSDSVLSDR